MPRGIFIRPRRRPRALPVDECDAVSASAGFLRSFSGGELCPWGSIKICVAAGLLFLSFDAFAGLADIEEAILRKDYAGAEQVAEAFLKVEQTKAASQKAKYYLGLSQLRQDRYKEARSSFKAAGRNGGDIQSRDRVYLGIFDSYYLEGNYKQGYSTLRQLLKKNPRPESMSLVYLKMARVNLKLAHWGEARDYLERLIRAFPNSLEVPLARQLLEEKQYFTVQVGAFKERERAEALVTELKQEREYAYIVETVDPQNRQFYRVRVGQLAMLNEAQKVKTRLAKLGYPAQIYP